MKHARQRRFSLTRHKHSLWLVPAFGLLLIAAVWIATWLQLGSTERALTDARIRDAENFVASYARYTQRQIKDGDRMARLAMREFERYGTLDLARFSQEDLIEDSRLAVIGVADAKGDVVASGQRRSSINIADRDYFRQHKEHDTGLLDISKPLVGRVSGRSIIVLSRRMNRADGSFAGIVLLSVSPSYFTDFAKQADPLKQNSLGLLGLDGTFRARVLDGVPVPAADKKGMELVARAEANLDGHYEAPQTDGAMRVVAYRKLVDYPLIVSAAQPTDEALSGFARHRINYLIIAVTATIVILGFFAVVTTLASRLERHRRELKGQRLFLKTIVDNLPLGVSVRSMQPGTGGQYTLWSDSNALIFGATSDAVLGKRVSDIMPQQYADDIGELDRQLLASPMVQDVVQMRDVPGRGRRAYHLIRAPIFGADGQVESIMTCATDITDERARSDELRLASKVFETTADAIVISDADDRVVMINAAFSKLTGHDARAVVGQILDESPFRPIDVTAAKTRDARLNRDGFVTAEVPRVRKDGTPLALWLTASCVRNDDGTIRNYVRVFTDISLLKDTQKKLEQLASFDTLTDLPNRRLLLDRLEQATLRARRSAGGLAVMFIDLDGLKHVNDTLGHDVGDLLLREAALRLQKCLRASDGVGRLGGDEFAIVLENAREPVDAARIGERIVAAFAPPFALDGHIIKSTASVGIAIYPQGGMDAATLLKSADAAMYKAKQAGRNQFKFFSQRDVIEAVAG